jgi:hypothetical protein
VKTGIHAKTLHPMFSPKGNPAAANVFKLIAGVQRHEGSWLQVVAMTVLAPALCQEC